MKGKLKMAIMKMMMMRRAVIGLLLLPLCVYNAGVVVEGFLHNSQPRVCGRERPFSPAPLRGMYIHQVQVTT